MTMRDHFPKIATRPPRQEHGTALVMALLMLLVLTLMGVATMNTTTLEEKMASNARERNLAFQAAESALRAGEDYILTVSTLPTFTANTAGFYKYNASNLKPWWDQIDWSSTSARVHNAGLTQVAQQPRYIIEEYADFDDAGTPRKIYRVTARGTGGTNFAVAMLQSTIMR